MAFIEVLSLFFITSLWGVNSLSIGPSLICYSNQSSRSSKCVPTLSKSSLLRLGSSSWDADENYDDEEDTSLSSNNVSPSLGINIGAQLDPLSAQDAQDLKDEATDLLNAAFDARINEIAELKGEVRESFERSKESLRYASKLRAAEETRKLMSKIDEISDKFLDQNEELREGTKIAASADRNMIGQGLELGSWGEINGMNVLTSSTGGMSMGLLGSVGAAVADLETSFDVDPGLSENDKNSIMIISDKNKDMNLNSVFTRLESLFCGNYPKSVNLDLYEPSSQIPMGGNDAKCCLICSTSLANGKSSAEKILDRILKRTVSPGGGKVSKPPTHIVVVSPLGTERIESFPYSMQNMMGGNRLKKAREVEEVIISTVKGRYIADSKVPPLDYTIVKWGEIVNDEKILSKNEGEICVADGDSLDGKIGVELAANVLFQAITQRPTARNSTLSVVGAMDETVGLSEEIWEDWFLRIDGPELWRTGVLIQGDESYVNTSFEELVSYINQWSEKFKDGAKGTGLTTPVNVVKSNLSNRLQFQTLQKHSGVRLEFQQTNTGNFYLSKSEEKEIENQQSGTIKDSKQSKKQNRRKREGGVEIIVEKILEDHSLSLRVRARRCNMDDFTVVKELSENTIIKQLKDAVDLWKRLKS